jgi:uncharacterized oligopeptide transporter (OPT) family protein
LGKLFLKTTILENNIIQTTGSAGESIAAGVVFTLPGFYFYLILIVATSLIISPS